MIYPTREEFETWLQSKPEEFFKTKTVCADCLRPMDEREIILRAIATVPFQTEVIIFTYVCGTSRMSAECIDALIYISAGFFDPDKWDFSPETIEAAIKCIMDGDPERRRQQDPARRDRLDWRAISSFQHMPADYRRKRAYFFRGNEKIIDFIPYRHKKPVRKLKKAEWL